MQVVLLSVLQLAAALHLELELEHRCFLIKLPSVPIHVS